MSSYTPKSTKVQKDGNTLVAAYHTASPPLIWKLDLERNHSFTLALQGQGNEWELGVRSSKDDFHSIARFASREDAEEAFAKTQKALFIKKRVPWKTFAIISMVLAIILFVLLLMVSHHAATMTGGGPKSPFASSSQQKAPALKEGVPMDADQILKPPP